MKKPKKPYLPKEPIKPNRKLLKSNKIYFTDLLPKPVRASVRLTPPNHFNIEDLLNSLPKDVPLKDVRIAYDYNRFDDYDYGYGHDDYQYFVEYFTEEDNINFERENLSYERAKSNYDILFKKKKALLEKYNTEKDAYDLFIKEQIRQRQEKQLNQKEKYFQDELKKIEKSREKLK